MENCNFIKPSSFYKNNFQNVNPNFLMQFDFSAIEEMDPSISDGMHIIYDREVPFELRKENSNFGCQEIGNMEAIKSKICILGEEEKPRQVKVEITSENDLFFHYTHCVDEMSYLAIQEKQKLMIQFEDFAKVFIKMLNSCIKYPQSFLAVFIIKANRRGELEFIQNMEYKFVSLLSCEFIRSSKSTIRRQITYRYNSLKSKHDLMKARLQDIGALVKLKNPSLFTQLQRTAEQSQNKSKYNR